MPNRIRYEVVAAVCASGLLPFGIDAFEEAIRLSLPAKLQEANLRALEYGREHFVNAWGLQGTFGAGPLAGHMLGMAANFSRFGRNLRP